MHNLQFLRQIVPEVEDKTVKKNMAVKYTIHKILSQNSLIDIYYIESFVTISR